MIRLHERNAPALFFRDFKRFTGRFAGILKAAAVPSCADRRGVSAGCRSFCSIVRIRRLSLVFIIFRFGKQGGSAAFHASRSSASRSGRSAFGHGACHAASLCGGAVQRFEQRVQHCRQIAARSFAALLAELQVWLDVVPVAHDDLVYHLPAYPWIRAGQACVQFVQRMEYRLDALIRQRCFPVFDFAIQAIA